MLKFKWSKDKEKWIILLVVGAILMILVFPDPTKKAPAPAPSLSQEANNQLAAANQASDSQVYEQYLEDKVKELLSQVEGVGTVDVMVVLKSSEERVFQVDTNTSVSLTDEQDNGGGVRKIDNREVSEETILQSSSGSNSPIITKEIKPAIAGIVVSASGGASPIVKAEISSAMEALFDIPTHKIKVLKRVE